MDRSKSIQVKEVFSAETILASGVATSDVIDLTLSSGVVSLQIALTGDGTGKFEYVASNDGVTYVTPDSVSDIVTAHTKTTGTSGVEIYPLAIAAVKFIKFTMTETSTTDAVAVTATLAVR